MSCPLLPMLVGQYLFLAIGDIDAEIHHLFKRDLVRRNSSLPAFLAT
jgi:hypothetical protein